MLCCCNELKKIQVKKKKKIYGHKSRLLFTDTDNLIYENKTYNVYKDFNKVKKMFNFSNYSGKLKYYDDANKLVVGKMKDETGGFTINKFVG